MAPAKKAAPPPGKRGRDARTGEFIPVKEAERRPKTTVIETVKPRKAPPSPKRGGK